MYEGEYPKRVGVRLRDEYRKMLDELVQNSKLSYSDYLRQMLEPAIHRRHNKVFPPKDEFGNVIEKPKKSKKADKDMDLDFAP